MTHTVEIRPGAIDERDLALVERALERAASPSTAAAHVVDDEGRAIAVPDELLEALRTIVAHLRAGHGVSVVSLEAELTTVEAAEFLNVSRPYLIKLLETGHIPFRRVGSHRRVGLADVLAYRDRQDASSRDALDALTRQAEELGLYA